MTQEKSQVKMMGTQTKVAPKGNGKAVTEKKKELNRFV